VRIAILNWKRIGGAAFGGFLRARGVGDRRHLANACGTLVIADDLHDRRDSFAHEAARLQTH